MVNIDDKLTYLSETKNIFKNSLNSLGAEITSSTTFRNYLNWLDSFYDDVSNKTDIITNGIVGRTSQSVGSLPIEYTQVDYIESSGTQYIDTGVNADSNLRVVLDMSYSVYPGNIHMGAIYNHGNGWYTRYHFDADGGQWRGYYDTSSYKFGTSNLNRHIFDFDAPNKVYKVDDVSSPTFSYTSFNTGLNYWLFSRSSNDSSLIKYVYAKLYNAKFYYNGELIRDFIPCYRRSDNEVGLYDIVNNVFYTNQGTGEFTYGAIVNTLSPDSPQPINNLTGNIAYKVSGKNLFDKDSATLNQYLDSSGNIVTPTDNVWYLSDYILVSPNEQYTYQGLTFVGNAPYSAYYDENKNLVSTFKQAVGVNTITIPNNVYYIRFSIINRTANNDFNLSTFMIEKGSTAGTYEPYIEPQTFTIPLGNIALNNIDGYVDNIHSENGKFYLYKETEVHILNGSENWAYNSSPSTPTPRTVAWITHTDFVYSKRYYSNRFVYGDTSTSNRLVLEGSNNKWYLSLDNTLTGITSSDTNAQKLTKMKTYMSNNNIEVYYVLNTSTTTEITSSNYPALYAVLKEIQDYLVSYKINKEFLLEYSSPEIEY